MTVHSAETERCKRSVQRIETDRVVVLHGRISLGRGYRLYWGYPEAPSWVSGLRGSKLEAGRRGVVHRDDQSLPFGRVGLAFRPHVPSRSCCVSFNASTRAMPRTTTAPLHGVGAAAYCTDFRSNRPLSRPKRRSSHMNTCPQVDDNQVFSPAGNFASQHLHACDYAAAS